MNWNVILAHDAIRIGTTLIPHADPHVKQDRDQEAGLSRIIYAQESSTQGTVGFLTIKQNFLHFPAWELQLVGECSHL